MNADEVKSKVLGLIKDIKDEADGVVIDDQRRELNRIADEIAVIIKNEPVPGDKVRVQKPDES